MAACSPKVIRPTVNKPVQKPQGQIDREKEIAQKEAAKKDSAEKIVVKKPVVKKAKVSSIALLLPFNLDDFDPNSSVVTESRIKSNIAVDFYEGFKLALDSLTEKGYNYKLTVFDTKDEVSQAQKLSSNPSIRNSDLIVGPVFPEGVQAFSARMKNYDKPVVSPLSAASPEDYNDPSLITLTPPLEFHAMRVAQYISENLRPKTVFILRSGFSEENKYILPFKKSIDSLGNKRIRIVDVVISKGNFSALLPKFSKTTDNIFVVPSTNRAFLTVTLNALDQLADTYSVRVFGHPSWNKATYLKPELLDKLQTVITSAYQVDYKSPQTIAFIQDFRNHYHVEPSEYAIKGFDTGMYFGKLLADPAADLKHFPQNTFDGLHNHFEFEQKKGYGWINTYVELLRYEDFALKPIE